MAVVWFCLPFAALATEVLYAILQVRQEVFAVEQGIRFVDADGLDLRVWHVFGISVQAEDGSADGNRSSADNAAAAVSENKTQRDDSKQQQTVGTHGEISLSAWRSLLPHALGALPSDASDSARYFLAAYARVFPPGMKSAGPAVGRVLTNPRFRKCGYGKELMQTISCAVETLVDPKGTAPIYLQAQSYLERFYTELGYRKLDEEQFLDEGIWHISMSRPRASGNDP